MALRHVHLQQAQHHLAEIDEHISAQRSLVVQLRKQGHDAAQAERLLQNLLEAQLVALAHWRLAANPPR